MSNTNAKLYKSNVYCLSRFVYFLFSFFPPSVQLSEDPLGDKRVETRESRRLGDNRQK